METEPQIPLGQNSEASREGSHVVVDGTWLHLLMCWQSRMTRCNIIGSNLIKNSSIGMTYDENYDVTRKKTG